MKNLSRAIRDSSPIWRWGVGGGWVVVLIFFLLPLPIQAANPFNVVINEMAWMGTETSYADEWIELYNNTNSPIKLEGWLLKAINGSPEINLAETVPARSFYLLERTDDNTIPNISADQIYTGALENKGENLELYDNFGNLIDSVNCSPGWFAGDNFTKQTMERKKSQISGNNSDNWQTSQNPGGTPKAKNSIAITQKAKSETGTPKIEETQRELAAISKQIPEEASSFLPLLIALALAIFSGIIILILKKKIKEGRAF